MPRTSLRKYDRTMGEKKATLFRTVSNETSGMLQPSSLRATRHLYRR
jgi:hypothetical protein